MRPDRHAEQSFSVPANKRSAPGMVTMSSEDDAPTFNFRAGMKPDM
jgi:hypothetical protein